MREIAVVIAAVVAGGLALPGMASAVTTATGPCAGHTGLCEPIQLTLRSSGGGQGNRGGGGNCGGQGSQGGGGNGGGQGGQGSQGGGGNGGGGGQGSQGGGRSGSAGDLSLAVPASATLTVASNGTTARGYLAPMHVSDTRQSSPGWTVFGQASASGGVISANDVGWTPAVTSSSGQVTVGRAVFPDSPGLGAAPAKLGSSAGPGAATLGASLSVAIPARQVIGPHGVPPVRTIILSLTITLTTTAA
jgi:hypothetical protein